MDPILEEQDDDIILLEDLEQDEDFQQQPVEPDEPADAINNDVQVQVETIAPEPKKEENHRFFKDQINLNRPKWPKERWWFSAMAMAAYMIDMSNIQTFPVLLPKYGGLAFVVAYLTVIVCLVYPMLYLEVLLGQYFQTGMIGVWGICPVIRGLGPGLLFLNSLIYCNLAHALWAVLMLIEALHSIQTGVLRWSSCDNAWNTCHCAGNRNKECLDMRRKVVSTDLYSPGLEHFLGYVLQIWKTHYSDPLVVKEVTQNGNWSTAYGFGNDKEGVGPMITQSVAVVVVIFCMILFIAMAPIKYQGYLYTFTGFFPILVLTGLVCRAVTLEGAFDGVSKYFKTDFTRLKDMQVWTSALKAAFYSIAPGLGCHVVVASFSPLKHDFRRDITVAISLDTSAHLLSALVAFMFVGSSYKTQEIPLPDDFPGKNFPFVTFAESFGNLSGSAFFAATFYFMMVMFSIDTQVVAFHAMSFSLYEEYKRKYPTQDVSQFLFLFSLWGFALSLNLIFTTRGGYWIYAFMQDYLFGFSALIFLLVEIVTFSWIWGIDETCKAAEATLGSRSGLLLRLCWKFILPVFFLFGMILDRIVLVLPPVHAFGQVAPAKTRKWGLIFVGAQWIGPGILLFYMVPEYEHDSIMANKAKDAKRRSCSHYFFVARKDEIKEMCRQLAKTCGIKQFTAIRDKKTTASVASRTEQEKPEMEREQELIRKKERKKKGHRKKRDSFKGNAWDMWEEAMEKKYRNYEDDDGVSSAGSDDKNELRRKSSDSSLGSSNDSNNDQKSPKQRSAFPKKKKPRKVKRNQVKAVNTVQDNAE